MNNEDQIAGRVATSGRTPVWLVWLMSGLAVSPLAEAAEASLSDEQRRQTSEKIHAAIVAKEKEGVPKLEAYQVVVPKAKGAKLEMLPVQGGMFVMGSPTTEKGRGKDEGPQVELKLEGFWMSKVEIPWRLYAAFYQNGQARHSDGSLKAAQKGKDLVDIVCQPTPQYYDLFLNNSFRNDPDHPAMSMTHHAASKFCQWLSAQTGHYYRLPTEAEWEYACRAGSKTAWSFGDDVSKLGEYAWYEDNSNFTYQAVGQKKPNPWGFHDMHGNVAEWVIDQYSPTFYGSLKPGSVGPWNRPLKRYPRVVRGGSWDNMATGTRSAVRAHSSKAWKALDPQVPKSVWYQTTSQHVGFRVVRPLKTPSAKEMHFSWNSDWWSPERNAEDL